VSVGTATVAAVKGHGYLEGVPFCPNVACPHRRRCHEPAEYVNTVAACADCGWPLVEDVVVARAGTTPAPMDEVRGYREPPGSRSVFDPEAHEKAARIDLFTGASLVVLSIVLALGSYLIAIGPFLYGLLRLSRGLAARKRPRRQVREDLANGPAAGATSRNSDRPIN
jgi:hypothetical protein